MSFDKTKNAITLHGTVMRETDAAILFLDDKTDEELWLPKSQIVEQDLSTGTDIVTITEWIAKQKGLV